jgi:hypothetical protein
MSETEVIFSDRIETDGIEFNAWTEARISVAERQGRLIL